MKDDTGWHWTSSPTPGLVNILAVPPPVATTTKAKTTKKAATKKKATKKATPKKIAGKTKKSPKSKDPVQNVAATPAAIPPGPNYWLLGTVGTLAAGYAAYEYRQNIARGIRKVLTTTTGGER